MNVCNTNSFTFSPGTQCANRDYKAEVYSPVVITIPPSILIQHRGRKCGHCKYIVQGVLFKCIHSACPNFECCENCLPIIAHLHPAAHVFSATPNIVKVLMAEEEQQRKQKEEGKPADTSPPVLDLRSSRALFAANRLDRESMRVTDAEATTHRDVTCDVCQISPIR